MEFEKVMWPFILFSKKRYACVIYTEQDHYDYIDYKGIQVVRRDNCPYVKEKSINIFETILLEKNMEHAKEMAREYIKNILSENVPIKELVISKSLKGFGSYAFDNNAVCTECDKKWYKMEGDKKNYKIHPEWKAGKVDEFIKTEKYCENCKKETKMTYQLANIPHVKLAREMAKRDPFNCPDVGERVPYVFIKTGNKNHRQFERIEDPTYTIDNNLGIDYEYYWEHQFKSAIDTIFYPILREKLPELYEDLLPPKPEKKKKVLKIK